MAKNRSVRDLLRVEPGTQVTLAGIDPRSTPGVKATAAHPKAWSLKQVAKVGAGLTTHQEQLYARAKAEKDPRRVLLVLQAMDCGGKDGTINHVVGQLDPLGLSITGFGPPTPEEQAHPFLWRIRRALPPAGYVGIFNRSHYEDVLVARVHNLVPENVWSQRYDAINEFEAELAASGCAVLKVMLHISYEEQRRRLAERLEDPTKRWKYNPHDLDERARWDEYQAAYADALSRCSTAAAPWYVVPADRKWYRNWAVAHLLRETFADLDLAYPEPAFDLATERRRVAAGVKMNDR